MLKKGFRGGWILIRQLGGFCVRSKMGSYHLASVQNARSCKGQGVMYASCPETATCLCGDV